MHGIVESDSDCDAVVGDAARYNMPTHYRFMEASYRFTPVRDSSANSVLLSVCKGDLIWAHFSSENGWVDGTSLTSGNRGWAPADYFKAYDPQEMRELLKALVEFWVLPDSVLFDYREISVALNKLRGIGDCTRIILAQALCFDIQPLASGASHDLSMSCKTIVCELASLDRTVEQFRWTLSTTIIVHSKYVDSTIDKMISKARSVVIKSAVLVKKMHYYRRRLAIRQAYCSHTDSQDVFQLNDNKKLNLDNYCLSLAGQSALFRVRCWVSSHLRLAHDNFLSCLGYLIGSLQASPLSQSKFAKATSRVAASSNDLFVLLDKIRQHNTRGSSELRNARASLLKKVEHLLAISESELSSRAFGEASLLMLDNELFLNIVVDCVKVAHECVTLAETLLPSTESFDSNDWDALIKWSMWNIFLEQPTDPLSRHDYQSDRSGIASREPGLGLAAVQPPRLRPPQSAEGLREGSRLVKSESEVLTSMSLSSSHCTSDGLLSFSGWSMTSKRDPPSSSASYSKPLRSEVLRSPAQTKASKPSTSTTTLVTNDWKSQLCPIDLHKPAPSKLLPKTDYPANTRTRFRCHTLQMKGSESVTDQAVTIMGPAKDGLDKSVVGHRPFAHELLVGGQGQVISGSLRALVEHVTDYETNPSDEFLFTFYLTFRLFCQPSKLANTLLERFNGTYDSLFGATTIRLKVCHFFRRWLETYWDVQADGDARTIIEGFAQVDLATSLPRASMRILYLLQSTPCRRPLAPVIASPSVCTSSDIASPQRTGSPWAHTMSFFLHNTHDLTVLDVEPSELARQLTLKEMEVFCSICPDELLATRWMKAEGMDAANVRALSALTTSLSNLVTSSILRPSSVSKRAASTERWIEVARCCLNLRNYESLLAIMCSLSGSAVGRLKRTWAKVSRKHQEEFDSLRTVSDPSRNYHTLRQQLDCCGLPCLPFLGMYLKDLVFIDTGNPDTRPLFLYHKFGEKTCHQYETAINFDKFRRTGRIIREIRRFQQPYTFQTNPRIQKWTDYQIIQLGDREPEKLLASYYQRSLHLEPRDTSFCADNGF